MFLLLFQAMLNQKKKQYNISGSLTTLNSGIRKGLTQRQPGDKKKEGGGDRFVFIVKKAWGNIWGIK